MSRTFRRKGVIPFSTKNKTREDIKDYKLFISDAYKNYDKMPMYWIRNYIQRPYRHMCNQMLRTMTDIENGISILRKPKKGYWS